MKIWEEVSAEIVPFFSLHRRRHFTDLWGVLSGIISERIDPKGTPKSVEDHVEAAKQKFRGSGDEGLALIHAEMNLALSSLKTATSEAAAAIRQAQQSENMENAILTDLNGETETGTNELIAAQDSLRNAENVLREARDARRNNPATLSSESAKTGAVCREQGRQVKRLGRREFFWSGAALAVVTGEMLATIFFLWDATKPGGETGSLWQVMINPSSENFGTALFAAVTGVSVTFLLTIFVHWALQLGHNAFSKIEKNDLGWLNRTKAFLGVLIVLLLAGGTSYFLTQFRMPASKPRVETGGTGAAIQNIADNAPESIVITLGILGASLFAAKLYERARQYRAKRKALGDSINAKQEVIALDEGATIHSGHTAQSKVRTAQQERRGALNNVRSVWWRARFTDFRLRYHRRVSTMYRAGIHRRVLRQYNAPLWRLSGDLYKIANGYELPPIPELKRSAAKGQQSPQTQPTEPTVRVEVHDAEFREEPLYTAAENGGSPYDMTAQNADIAEEPVHTATANSTAPTVALLNGTGRRF